MMTIREWGEENGANGACKVCGRKIWVEHGCAALCDGCEEGDEDYGRPDEPDTLANLGMCEADFR